MNTNGNDEGPIRVHWLSPDNANRELARFQSRFGPKALFLASHAAVPLVLSPDLLHLIRINFVESFGVPSIAEADLLLSPLCRPLEEPLYEMEPRIREMLLEHLAVDFGEVRSFELADFLLFWLKNVPEARRSLEETDAHEWVYDAWIRPEKIVERLSADFTAEAGAGHRSARLRLAILAEALAVPLTTFEDTKDEYRRLLVKTRAAANESDYGHAAAEYNSAASNKTTSLTPGTLKSFRINQTGPKMEFSYIPPGEFMMGSPEDEPGRYDDESLQHLVRITQGFYMQTTPVTQAQWESVMGDNPSEFKNAGPDAPVESVSWDDVQGFLKKLNAMTEDAEFRLPSEAEWEYACRAGTTTALYNGPIEILGERNAPALDPIAWYGGNSGVEYGGAYDSSGWSEKQVDHQRAGTHPVGKKQPNAWGLYDMIGNVLEWCEDYFEEDYYQNSPLENPSGPKKGSRRVLRGGSWADLARLCRSASRDGPTPPGYRFSFIGFRVVVSFRAQ